MLLENFQIRLICEDSNNSCSTSNNVICMKKMKIVVLSLEKYASLVDNVEMKLDEADEIAENTEERLSHDDVFRNVKSVIHGK